jgi:hypothetical protein
MTDQAAADPKKAKRMRTLFYLLCILLIGNFVWRMLITAQEYPPRSSQILEMIIDAGCIVGLIAGRKFGPQPLFVTALIAGIGLFAIRLHSDASWWTGHYHYIFDKR